MHRLRSRFSRDASSRRLAGLFSALLLGGAVGCGPEPSGPRPSGTRSERPTSAAVVMDLDRYSPRPIGHDFDPAENPWIAHVITADLDQDGRLDILACEAKDNTLLWLRQQADGSFVEQVLAGDLRAPVHVEASDMDGDGDLDLVVSSMGIVFPNNDKIGTLFILENDGAEHFTSHIILENVARVVDARPADLTGDGLQDLIVGQFGYDQGEVRWLRRTGPGLTEWSSEIVLRLSGTVNVVASDFSGNGAQDFVALVSQQWEEVWFFQNEGAGNFRSRVLWGSTNEEFSLSGMSLADLNGDGHSDILFTNGDGFGPTPEPGPQPWHGVQWLENNGYGGFRFHRIGALGGAYSPIGVDVDGDGHLDVVASGAFSDWSDPRAESLVWFRNDGAGRFTKHVLAHQPTHLISIAAGDFDNDGIPELVTGAFHAYPPYDRKSRLVLWQARP